MEVSRQWWVQAVDYGKLISWWESKGDRGSALWWRSWGLQQEDATIHHFIVKTLFFPRQKYVDLYVDFVFNKSVKKQFSHFSRGFSEGCPLDVWSMFHPEELQELLHGSPKYEWKELQQVNTRNLPIYDVLNISQYLSFSASSSVCFLWKLFCLWWAHQELLDCFLWALWREQEEVSG